MALSAAGSARAADPQPYAVTIETTGDSAIDSTLGESAQLVTLHDKVPVPPFALIARARSDIPRLQTALDSFGYYLNNVSITIGGRTLADSQLPPWLDSVPPNTSVDVKVAVDKGPLFHLGKIEIQGTIPESTRQALGIRSGDVAIAANVLDARTRLLDALQEDGYALAGVEAPIVHADDGHRLLDVTYEAHAGPQVEIGTISFKGLKDVNEEFARRVLTIKTGDRYRPSAIEKARRALVAQGVFSGVNVRAADHLSADGRLPLTFDVEERKRHAVTIAGTYSTDLGISLSTTWSHRNLFGSAEQLNLTAAGTGLGTSTTGVGYNLSAQFIKPLFLRPDQTLELDLSGIKENLEAYDQTAQTLAGFLRRRFSEQWSASAGLSLTHDDVSQQGVDRIYELLAAPLTASYDTTGIADIPLDPTGGVRASLVVTPTRSFGGTDVGFFVLQISGSTYFDLAGNGRSVLALRGLAATILGASANDLPPDQRLYAGGSGTVRGFAYQSIGPQFADGNPEGAKSVDAATLEFRQRIGEDWGGAAFVDAGQASAAGAPFTGTVEVGAGLGARYYTSIGVLRLDLAVPLTHIDGGDTFEIYAGLGQAF
jgi:translocation and assembly module TamA